MMNQHNINRLSKLMERLSAKMGLSPEELRGGCRRRGLVDARSLVAAAMMEVPDTRQADVAEMLNLSQVAVSKLLKRHRDLLQIDPTYRQRWHFRLG